MLDNCSWYVKWHFFCRHVSNHCCRVKQLKSWGKSHKAPHYACIIFHTSTFTFQGHTLKVKCDLAIGLPIYDLLLLFNTTILLNLAPLRDTNGLPTYEFLLMLNRNIHVLPNFVPLRDIMLQGVSDVDFDLSMSRDMCYGYWTPDIKFPSSM